MKIERKYMAHYLNAAFGKRRRQLHPPGAAIWRNTSPS